MKDFKFKNTSIFILFFLIMLLTSCGKPKAYKLDLSDKVEYCEFPPEFELPHVLHSNGVFKPLSVSDRRNLSSLLENKDNFIWLRINFEIPEPLKNKELGLYISQLRSASRLYLNNNMVRQYGNFPPHELSSGFQSLYFVFSSSSLIQDGTNSIYIKIWPGLYGTLSSKLYLSSQEDVFHHSETVTFFNSKIILIFLGVMFIIFFLYLFLYFVSIKTQEIKNYIYYGLINFYTIHFLIAMNISDFQWSTLTQLSYLGFVKFFLLYGVFSTIYFANAFIISYLQYKASYKNICIRMAIFLVSIILSFSMPSFAAIEKFIPVFVFLGILPFGFSVYCIIKAFLDNKRRKYVFSLLSGFTPVLIAVIIDGIIHAILHKEELPIFTLYGWQLTIYIFLGTLLKRFGKMYIHNTELKNQLEEFTAHLEDVVTLRTKELSDANSILSRGIETVSHVQHNFLPPRSKIFRGWELAIYYKPLDNNVSGDLYDYYSSDASLDGLGIFDVSGHGIPAGLMTILAKGIISQHFLNGLEYQEPISDVLKEINKTYIKEKVNVDNYITGILFRFSEFNQKGICSVELANAGHPCPLFYNSKEDTVTELKFSDPSQQYGIIGIEGLDVSFPPVSCRMSTNDMIVCYTDGLSEALNINRKEYTKDRIMDFIQKNNKESAQNILDNLVEDLNNYCDGQTQSDDITIVVLKRTNPKDYIEEI